MVDNSTASHSVSHFLLRRHSTGNGVIETSLTLPPYPPTTVDHLCREFTAPEGVYQLSHSIFVNALQPLYSIGTTATLVSIKYKRSSPIEQDLTHHNDNPTLSSFLTRSHTKSRKKTFVQKIITNDQLAKILMARTSADINVFYNCGTSFVWMDAAGHPKEPLSRIVFSNACPTSHDVNILTRGVDHLDIIIGFTTGDIIWFDPLCNKYGRMNKDGIMNSSSVTMIKWLQGYENLFMASFQDGSVMLFDKEKEDVTFHPGDAKDNDDNKKSMFTVSKPPSKIASKCNPVSHWKLSNQAITAFAFSPDCQHVAIVGLDGLLRIINFLQETMSDVHEAYYGGLFCVAWSPDGKYILTGGQDDLVTIWDFKEQRIIARCQGHKSWVRGVAFDPWRCDETIYRFASIGEDARLIFWDFSVNALHMPKISAKKRNRGTSVSSVNSSVPITSILATIQERKQPIVHPVLLKTQVAFLQPTVVKTIHGDPCIGIYFREDVIVTTDKRGRVSIWKRPLTSATSQ
ncbi:WD40-repeat-containing domain protein [Cokeromyces recurvatus]|uniref:WD40-repeat-containing domain protein n=1 Tax=Cokeromyces recurvatus TaxID=90255 RepID=UPI00221F63EC|nr:WD40-repeat-containing domain protein [Cokeromyces recurvatus]KAI7898075.1 WD40-repeat-containing domain protein [Cokeromyces recurvatus]